MNEILLAAVVLCGISFGAFAQDDEFNFADHGVSLQQIVKEWHGQNLYTAGWDDNPGIRNYFVGLSDAYPNDLFQQMVHKMLGLDVDNAVMDYVMDEKNGYASGTLGTETSPSVQMCYWKCNDGSRLIAVAVQGYEYRDDDGDAPDDEDEDNWTVCINDLAFFRIQGDELLWRPVPVRQVCGRDFDFKDYFTQLPRTGKDIQLTDTDGNVLLLKWNGSRFTATKL